MNIYRKSIIFALVLFVLDALVLNQGFIAILLLVIVSPAMLIRAFNKRKDKYVLRKYIISTTIYISTAILVLFANYLNNSIAENRAGKIIKACEEYRVKYGAYPNTLSDLTPGFLQNVPYAKYVIYFNRFDYHIFENKHSLTYTSIPPFERKIYNFEENEWICID